MAYTNQANLPVETKKDILEILQKLDGVDPLKELFWSRLSYDRVNEPLSRQAWGKMAKNALAEDPVLWASGGAGDAFHVIYAQLDSDRLLLSNERPIVNALLREHPYALFVFSNEAQDRWHFVNVRIATPEDQEAEENRDPLRRRLFRRITIGPEERLRTAAERIVMLDLETIQPDPSGQTPLAIQQRHDEAFDVEAVTRRFYDEYKAIFDILRGDLGEQAGDRAWAHDFALQFLNRCTFIYFIQRKRWLNDDPNFLKTFWDSYKKADQPHDTFYERWLKILFFEAFNKKFHGGHQHFPKNIKNALQLAPYLNGGLFEENDLDLKYSSSFTLSDTRFRQVLTFLERYNFTISEDTPLDQEVAVDAEMLGKVYEGLVNVSEEADERGDAGIFYTPRTEIDMMCRLALVDHLANHLGQERKAILYEMAFAYSADEKAEADERLSKANLWPKLDALLQNITVVDPACGSGSFLIGMLQVLDDLSQRADAVLRRQETPYERRKRIIGRSLYGVDVMRWAVDVAELRLWLRLVIETELEPVELKFRPLLPNLSFKVRCGDSLVQELGGINMAHLKGTQDISPTLKKKLSRLKGEKLKHYNNDKSGKFKTREALEQEERNLFRDILEARTHDLSNRLKQTKRNLDANATNLLGDTVSVMDEAQRRKSQAKAAALRAEHDQATKALNALTRARDIPFIWDIAFVEIFGGERRGFDIVIGNPPYVRQESISDPLLSRDQVSTANKKNYKAKLIRSVYAKHPGFFGTDPDRPKHKLNAKSDLYIYFFFHGLSLLDENGSFCFITSNSWLDVGYGKDLQEFLLTHGHVGMIIDNKARRSFASADVNTAISLLSPPVLAGGKIGGKTARFVMFTVPFDQILSPVIFDEIEAATSRKTTPEYRLFPIEQKRLFEDGCDMPQEEDEQETGGHERREKTRGPLIKVAKYIGNKWGGKYLRAPDIYWTILEKGKGKLVRLGDIVEVRRGFTTGANEFFYLDEARICQWGIEAEFMKPVIKSPRECKRILIAPKDLKFKIFMCHKEKSKLRGTAALEYIKWGEERGFDERPSCQGRERWWDLGIRSHSQINANYLVNDVMRFISKRNGFFVSDNFQEIHMTAEYFWQLALSANSTILQLFANIIGRANFGGGLMKIQTYEVESLYLVNPKLLPRELCKDSVLEVGRVELEGHDRRELDQVVFDRMALTVSEREAVYEAVIDLVEARLRKADSLKPEDRKKRSRAASSTLGIWKDVPDDEDEEG